MISGGEDTAVIGLKTDFSRHDFVTLTDHLTEAKKISAAGGAGVVEFRDRMTGAEYQCSVAPSGTNGGGPFGYMPFLLRCGGLRLRIAGKWRQDALAADMPNIYAEVGSLLLMERGSLEAVWGDVDAIVRGMGGTIRKPLLSRVDCAFDLPGVPVDHFVERFRGMRYVCQARNRAEYREAAYGSSTMGATVDTGFVLGGDLKLRIYDKGRESQGDVRKRLALVEKRWGGMLPGVASRVEFQLRRETLKNRGIDTVGDWFEGRGEVVSWLVNEWFRFVEHSRAEKKYHLNRSDTDSVWAEIQASVPEIFGEGQGAGMPVDRKRMDHGTQRRKAFGQLMTIIADETDGDLWDVRDLFLMIESEATRWVEDLTFDKIREAVRKRAESRRALNKIGAGDEF